MILTTTNTVASEIWIHETHPAIRSFKLESPTGVIMGIDKIADVALIRVTSTNYSSLHLKVKDSRTELSIGEYINVIGYPQAGDPQSVTRGIVRDNKFQSSDVPESVYTDASIYGGNSGGPVITDSNHVVGILSWGQTSEENLNGGIASYLFKPILSYFCTNYVNSILNYPKGYVGIQYSNVTCTFPMKFNGIKVEGVHVDDHDLTINPTKFNKFDIITEVEGKRIGMYNNQLPFFTEIHLKPPNTVVNVKYLPYSTSPTGYGAEISKTITLSAIPASKDKLFTTFHRKPI